MSEREGSPRVERGRVDVAGEQAVFDELSARYLQLAPQGGAGGAQPRFRSTCTTVTLPDGWMGIDRVAHASGARASGEPPDALVVTVPIHGRNDITVARETWSSVCLLPYWEAASYEWGPVDVAVGMLDLDGVRRVGAELSGLEAGKVDFADWRPISPAWGRVVGTTVAHLSRHVMVHDKLATSPVLAVESFRQMATVLLQAFPNSSSSEAPRGPDSGEPATVRRATEFIDAHAGDGISLTDIARAARIGPRGLQAAFKRHRGESPSEYLRRARMQGAHRDLQAGDPTRSDTVAAIAARWGFGHPGRFSVEYRQVFGVSAVETLHR